MLQGESIEGDGCNAEGVRSEVGGDENSRINPLIFGNINVRVGQLVVS